MYPRRILAASVLAAVLGVTGAAAASAHVHLVNPLRCTPAPANAGANQTNDTPAAAANGGPISGVIPISAGGAVEPRNPSHFGACR